MGSSEIDPALADLCRTEYVRLVGLLALYTGDRAVGEDLAQEVLLRAHRRWARVRDLDSPRAWLATVGINLARSWWRRRYAEQRAYRRHGSTTTATVTASGTTAGPEPSDVLAVRGAVAALPPRQKAALVLRYYGGLSVAETAEALGCAEGTVKSLTHKAIAALRTGFEVDDPQEVPHA